MFSVIFSVNPISTGLFCLVVALGGGGVGGWYSGCLCASFGHAQYVIVRACAVCKLSCKFLIKREIESRRVIE